MVRCIADRRMANYENRPNTFYKAHEVGRRTIDILKDLRTVRVVIHWILFH